MLRRLWTYALAMGLVGACPCVSRGVDSTWTLDGDGNWNVPGNWSGGEPSNNTYDVFIDDGSHAVVVTLNVSRAIGTLTLGAGDELFIAEDRELHIAGTSVVNNGLISLNDAGGANSNFDINNQVTLSGTGKLRLGGSPTNRVIATVGATRHLINSASHTIEGGGLLGINDLQLTNHGLIDANIPGATITIDPNNLNATNTGTMRASGGGTLRLQGGVYTNTGAFIRALNGSVVELIGGGGAAPATIIGGTLATEGTGVIRNAVADGGVTLQDITLATGSLFEFGANLDANALGTITNNGAFVQPSNGGTMQLNLPANTTFTGSGVWTMTGTAVSNSLIRSTTPGITFINDSNHTIQGQGSIGGASNINIENKGLILANQPHPLTIQTFAPGGTINTGTLRATSGAVLNVTSAMTSNGGLLQADDASTINLNNGPVILNGTTITTSGTGAVAFAAVATAHAMENVAINGLLQIANAVDVALRGTIANNGTVEQNSSASQTDAMLDGDVTLLGNGIWKMSNNANNRIRRLTSGPAAATLTNSAGHTIQGAGALGSNEIGLVNRGVIIADQATALTIDPSALDAVNEATGVMRGAGTGGLIFDGGTFNNQGIIEALNGSNVTYNPTAVTANNLAGVLTGGTWRATSTGAGATLTLRGNSITQIAPATTVELNGTGSVLEVQAGIIKTPLEATLAANSGTLRILGGRNYSATPTPFSNAGTLELGGGTFSAGILSNAAGGIITGFGATSVKVDNLGTVRASGGTLAVPGIKSSLGSTVVQTDPGATLDLSGASAPSTAGFLMHNGAGLDLGAQQFAVGADYTNANFGVGNSFNPRANVTGAGQINTTPGIAQSLSGDVTGGATPNAAMSFGNVHVGDNVTKNYQINNVGASGPVLRGAIQTSVGGANLTDGRLSGAGVTAGNFGPITTGAATPNLSVTFNAATAGALTGQQVRIVNNFDNVAEQTLAISGAAYRYAVPFTNIPNPVNFGIVHVGDVVETGLSIRNNAINDGFSERLNASIGSPTGSATTNNGSVAGLLPGGPFDTTSLVVGVDTTTAGVKTGTAAISFVSSGAGTSGLANTPLPGHTVNVSATVNNFAVAQIVKAGGAGTLTLTGPNTYTLDLGATIEGQADLTANLGVKNNVAAPADSLAGSFTLAAPGYTLSGFNPFGNLAAGQTTSGLMVTLDSAAAGTVTGQITLMPQSTNPRPFSMNLPAITINLTGVVRLAADFDENGVVNSADLSSWKTNFGAGTTHMQGNADGDGDVDGADFLTWQRQMGAAAPAAAAAGTVPEPSALGLAILASVAFAAQRRRRML